MEKVDIAPLFQKYLNNECTAKEIELLLKHFSPGENETLLNGLVLQQMNQNDPHGEPADDITDAIFEKIQKNIAFKNEAPGAIIRPLHKQRWFHVAASIVFMLISATALIMLSGRQKQDIAFNNSGKIKKENQVVPGKDNAILTLADGTSILLDSAANGNVASQGNMKVIKLNGIISYTSTGTTEYGQEPSYNTITTATGNQYQLILSDGSKVWLNAASSIRFPTAFTEKERKVEVTGEAYFEVAKNPSRPFRVFVNSPLGDGGMEVEVLGTHFNINSYADEGSIKTTLLEGSVKIKAGAKVAMLAPGHQAELSTTGSVNVLKDVDTEEIVAWKNGSFLFNNQDIESIMRQISRWYDVEISYEGKISHETFSGIMSRNTSISQVLKIMEAGGNKFRLEGRKIIVIK